MSDENVVYAKVDLLSEKVRAVLMALLKKAHYTSDLQGLFRGMDGLDMEFYEAEAALTALARRGFVRANRAQEWLHYGRAAYAIPRETALVMRGLAGTDRRPLSQVFVHEGFTPAGVESLGTDEPGAVPDDVGEAIASLPTEALRTVAAEVLDRYGGILSRHEFAEVFGRRGIPWQSAVFLEEFGSRGLGTVGHLDMRAQGIGVDDDALLFFKEVVEKRVAERRAESLVFDLPLRAHGDLMSDVRTALDEVREASVRVAKEGSVYKSARSRLAEKLRFQLQPLLERDEVADRVLALARGLGLAAENGHGELAVTEKGDAWRDLPLVDKVRDAYGLLLRDGVKTLRSRHLEGLHRILVELLREDDDAWWPGASVGLIARNRYLLDLEEQDSPPGAGASLSIRHAALTELGKAAQDLAQRDLFALGLVEVALKAGEPVGVRLSRLGRRLLRDAEAVPAETTRPLVVNPDFEVLVLPEGDVDELLHGLDRIAVRERHGEVAHYRLDRERVERAAVEGEDADAMVDYLRTHARTELPQNVVYSLREWGGKVRSASLQRGVLFTVSDRAAVQTILANPSLKECVIQVVGDTAVFFDEKVLERSLAQELKTMGIHLR